MDSLIHWLNSTALNKFIMSEPWLWPSLEIFHFFGLCLLLGSLIVSDLRMLGFARSVPMRHIETFMTGGDRFLNKFDHRHFVSHRRSGSLLPQYRLSHQDGINLNSGTECRLLCMAIAVPNFARTRGSRANGRDSSSGFLVISPLDLHHHPGTRYPLCGILRE